MNVFLRLFFFYFFVLAHQKLFCWSWTPSVAQRAAVSHRIFYFAFVSSAILYVLVLDLGDLICSGLVWPHRRKQPHLHQNHLFNVFLSFIYYLQPRFVRRSGSRLNIPPVPVNVRSSLKNEQVQAARQETAGGRQKIFLCGVLVSLLNSLDNNACGEAKRYEGRMCLKVWESVERQKKRWIELGRLQLFSCCVHLICILSLSALKPYSAQLWRRFNFAFDFFSENLFIALPELKMNPSNCSQTPSDWPVEFCRLCVVEKLLLFSFVWLSSDCFFFFFSLHSSSATTSATAARAATWYSGCSSTPAPFTTSGSCSGRTSSTRRSKVRKRKDLTVVVMCVQTRSDTLCSSE